jgi:cysteine-rich repeat protein
MQTRHVWCGFLAILLLAGSAARPMYAALPPAVAMVTNPNNGTLTVFDMNTDTVLGSVNGLGEVLDCSLDGQTHLGYAGDFANHVWAIDVGASPPVLAAGTNPIGTVIATEDTTITADGHFLISCDGGFLNPISVIDLMTRTEVHTLSLPGSCTGVEVCTDGSVLVVQDNNNVVRRLTIDSGGNLTDTGETLPLTAAFNVVCGKGGQAGVAISGFGTIQSFKIPGLTPVDSRTLAAPGISAVVNATGDRVYVRSGGMVAAFTFDSTTGALGAAPLVTIPVAGASTYYGVDQVALNNTGTKLYVTAGTAVQIYDSTSGSPLGSITDPSLNSAAGICVVSSICGNGVLEGGEECDDGNLIDGDGCDSNCTVTACGNGIVTAGEACDDGNLTDGDCCSSTCTPAPDNTPCDDGLFCNGTDTCVSGACAVHTGNPCTGGAECNNFCNEASDTCLAPSGTPCTDDGNVCTDDQCDGMGTCAHPANFFVPCDDGVFCDGADFCSGGSCSFHEGDPCLFNECATTCDETAAACDPDAAGTTCFDDGNVCTTDQCDGAGTCTHPPGPSGVPCPDDGNICTTDQCDGAGVCAHPPGPSGVTCPDDGNVCTLDRCDGAGVCAHPPGPSGIACPGDSSPCTKDLCDGMGTCGHPRLASGTACPDDGNVCTHDQCDDAGLCAHPAVTDGTACDDANACTHSDSCQDGVCVGADPVVCATVPCHGPTTCDHTTGTCTSCPAGYVQGDGGCQKTYAIDASLLDNLPNACDGLGVNRYSCATPFGFHWIDAADDSVGAATQVDVLLNTGRDCTAIAHTVSLDTMPIGIYASTAAAACSCLPPLAPRTVSGGDTATYAKGGLNEVSISTTGCAGLSPDDSGQYAVVTVTYEDPGLMVLMQSGCRQAGKSHLKYTNSVTDTKDKLQWKWARGATTVQQDFGDPTTSADYQLCVFAESSGPPTVLFAAAVPASASRWSALGTVGYEYLDKAASQDGMSEILVRGGAAGRSKIVLRGKGAGLSDPALPLAPADGIRVQLTNQSTGICWESEFPLSAIGGGIHASAP